MNGGQSRRERLRQRELRTASALRCPPMLLCTVTALVSEPVFKSHQSKINCR